MKLYIFTQVQECIVALWRAAVKRLRVQVRATPTRQRPAETPGIAGSDGSKAALSREQPANVGPNTGDCRRWRWLSEPLPFKTLLSVSRDRLNTRRRLCYTNTVLENRPRGGFKRVAPAHDKTGPFHGNGRFPTGRSLVAGQVKQPAPQPRPGNPWLARPSGRHSLRPAFAGRSVHSLPPAWRRAFGWSFDPCLTSAYSRPPL